MLTAASALVAMVAWTVGAHAGAGLDGAPIVVDGAGDQVTLSIGIVPFLGLVWLPAVVFLLASRSWRYFHVR
jgi:hypothetical protein